MHRGPYLSPLLFAAGTLLRFRFYYLCGHGFLHAGFCVIAELLQLFFVNAESAVIVHINFLFHNNGFYFRAGKLKRKPYSQRSKITAMAPI